jgi:hypothetical protein
MKLETLATARVARGLLLTACALVLGLGALASNVFPDEGFYLLAAQNVRHGLLPFRDFAFFHMPGAAAFIALFLPLTGPSVLAMRTVFALVAFGAIAFAGRALGRARGARAELVFLTLFATNPFVLTALPMLASYTAPAALGLALVAGGWALAQSDERRGAFVAGIGFGVATGVRIAYAPVALAGAIFFAQRRTRLGLGRYLGGALLGFAVTSGPALRSLFDLRAAYRNIVTVQLERVHATPYLFRYRPFENRSVVFREILSHYGAAFALVALAVLWGKQKPSRFTGVLAAVFGMGLLVHFVPSPTYLVYTAALAIPLFAAVAAWTAESPLSLRAASAVATLGLLTQTFVLVRPHGKPFAFLSDAARTLAHPDTGRVLATRAVARTTPAGSEIWTFDTTVAVEAERRVPPGFEMSFFGFYSGPLAPLAKSRGLLDLARALEPIESGRVAAVVASRNRSWWAFENAPAERQALWHAICTHYAPAERFADERYSELWLLLPRSVAEPNPACESLFASPKAPVVSAKVP